VLTLFCVSTSDNWSEVMSASVRQPGARAKPGPAGQTYLEHGGNLLKQYNSTGQFVLQCVLQHLLQ